MLMLHQARCRQQGSSPPLLPHAQMPLPPNPRRSRYIYISRHSISQEGAIWLVLRDGHRICTSVRFMWRQRRIAMCDCMSVVAQTLCYPVSNSIATHAANVLLMARIVTRKNPMSTAWRAQSDENARAAIFSLHFLLEIECCVCVCVYWCLCVCVCVYWCLCVCVCSC